jgi:hypothetical protein
MIECALLLAAYLNASPVLVGLVYSEAGLDGVAVVCEESHFDPRAERVEPEGTSWGLWQLYDRYHDQHRGDIIAHNIAGAAFLAECKARGGHDLATAVSWYNAWHPTRSLEWGRRVQARRDDLAHWLWLKLR